MTIAVSTLKAMILFRFKFSLFLLLGITSGLLSAQEIERGIRLRSSEVSLRYLEYEHAVSVDASGVPKMDWKQYHSRPEKVITRKVPSKIIENEWFRATIIPSMGRVHSFVHMPSGREQLWINPIAVPLGANNDTGFWMTWGGIEHVMPRREHGTSHALSWEWELVENDGGTVGIRMSSVEPVTGLSHQITYQANEKQPFLEARIRITNPGKESVRFSHWTTSTLAPGGQGDVTAKTEIIVPAEKFVPDDRDFNEWMTGMVGDVKTAPIRFVGAWKEIGDLMASTLKRGYYAVFSHETGDGLVRTFPLEVTPGFDIWGWGYPPSEQRQKEYTRAFPSLGYIEIWNGNVHGFKDHSLAIIEPGATHEWIERIAAIHTQGSDSLIRNKIDQLAKSMLTSSSNLN